MGTNELQVADLGSKAARGIAELAKRNSEITAVSVGDTGQMGELLQRMVVTAKGLAPEQLAGKGIMAKITGILGRTKERAIGQFRSVDSAISAIETELLAKAELHRRRIDDLEKMYVANHQYHDELTAAIQTIEQHAEEMRAQAPAVDANDPFSAQTRLDHDNEVQRLVKRADDLRRVQILSMQNAPAIRLMQDNARGLVQKFNDLRDVTLPAWRNTFTGFILREEQKADAVLTKTLDDATNDALRYGADLLRTSTQKIARSRARSVVSIDTLEHCQQQLLGALDDVQRIASEEAARLVAERPRIEALATELYAKVSPAQR